MERTRKKDDGGEAQARDAASAGFPGVRRTERKGRGSLSVNGDGGRSEKVGK